MMHLLGERPVTVPVATLFRASLGWSVVQDTHWSEWIAGDVLPTNTEIRNRPAFRRGVLTGGYRLGALFVIFKALVSEEWELKVTKSDSDFFRRTNTVKTNVLFQLKNI